MRPTAPSAEPQADRWSTVALWAFGAFTAFTLAGYATFGVHPQMLARVPSVAWVYGIAFRMFAVGQVCLAGAVLVLFLVRGAGVRWIGAFAALYAISLASELLGTTYGVPFGPYRYTELLGTRWLDRVPLVIPLSWFTMAVPSFAAALYLLPGPGDALRRVGLASLFLASWDLVLDPAMSFATAYWVWGEAGPYYGMPLLNLLGWYVTGLALMGTLAALRAERWIGTLSLRWLIAYYLVNLALPLGMSAAAGLWGAVLAAAVALAAGWGLGRLAGAARAHASTAELAA